MTLLSPSENLEIQYLMGVVNISISGKNNDKQKFLLGSWLLFWALVLLFPLTIAYQVISGNFQREGIPNSSLVILGVVSMLGIFFWGMRGVLAAYVLFLKIAGLETLEISRNGLKIRKSIFGIGKTKEYKKENITSIKLGTEILMPFAFTKFKFTRFEVPITGPILVNLTDRKITHLGLGLEPKQAEEIVVVIQHQLFSNHA